MRKKQKNTRWWVWVLIALGVFILSSIVTDLDSWETGPRVGIVEIHTPIISSREIIRDLNYFFHNDNIEAIIVHLDTPGGSVASSQEIYSKVKSISDSGKPIYASMGNVAASGGYYIALGADSIIANPGTATGSIGVIMGYPVFHNMMDKFGINYTTVKSGKFKDSGSSFRESSQEDSTYFQELVNNLYEQFVHAVSEERHISYEIVKSLADGRVYSGEQAKQIGLIDMLGTLEDAIHLAGRSTGSLDTPVAVKPPEQKKNIWDIVFGGISSRIGNNLIYPRPEYRIIY